MKTDLEKLKQLFDELGIKYQEATEMDCKSGKVGLAGENVNFEFSTKIQIDEGCGYSLFYTDFFFDADGKFINHGIWE